jgi:TolB protein
LQVLPDGSPVLYYEDSPSPESSQPIVAVCGDPACSSVEVTEVKQGMNPDGGAASEALPYWPYVSHDESVRLIACGDERCATILERELYRRFDGTTIVAADVSAGAEGTPVMAIETISQEELQDELSGEDGDGYATHQVSWVICGDPSCETVSVRELGEGTITSLVSLPDGSIAFAAQTGRPAVCLWDDCVDPTVDGLSTLTLYSCRGSVCSSPTTADLEPVTGDVTIADGGVGSAIVFAAEGDLYVLDPGPGPPGRLTEGPDWDGGPAWSPDGTRIAFHTDRDATEADRFENHNIYVMDADGTNTVQVTDHAAGEFFPDWSPDGTHLIFARQTEDAFSRHLVIVDLATGEEQQLTDPTSDADFPAWSPDGTKIAFSGRTSGDCTWEGTDCNTAIFTINTDGTGTTQLTDAPGIDSFPDWSPDGREIAFQTTRSDPTSGRWDIFVMSFDGMEVFPLTDYHGVDQFPSWSPDGAMVLFQSDRSGTPHLYTMRGTDGSELTLIAPSTPRSSFPDWSPATD